MTPTPLRAWVRALLRHATSGMPVDQATRRPVSEAHVSHIEGDIEALIWALGYVWSMRAEYLLSRIHPAASCVLLLLGLPVAAEVLIPHLTWYGLPQHQFGFPEESLRGLAKLAAYIVVTTLVASTTPGSLRRRVFGASVFPFLSLLALFASGAAHRLVDGIAVTDDLSCAAVLLHGLSVGGIVASALVVPTALLYRSTATGIAILAILPAIAKSAWDDAPRLDTISDLLVFACPFIWSLIVIVLATNLCQRYLRLPPPE